MKQIVLSLALLFIPIIHFAGTKFYRASFRDDPATTIVIGWSPSGTSTNAKVYYGTTDYAPDFWSMYTNNHGIDRTTSHQGITSNFARLTGLQPNTVYYFVIKDDQGVSSRMSFKTLSDNPNDPVCFIAGGDTRTGAPIVEYQSDQCRPRRQKGCDLVAQIRPDFIAFSGDFIFIPGDDGQWNDWWNDWMRTIGPAATKGRVIPVLPVTGNHEQNDDIYNFFDIPSADNYYAVNIGGNLARFYCLNSDLECDNTMLNWFETDLQNYTGGSNEPFWKIIQFHVPIAPHGEYSVLSNLIGCWCNLFRQYRVRLALEGHTHVMKITNPVVPGSGTGSDNGLIQHDNEGTVYLGEGSWGAPMRELYTSAGGKAFAWTHAQDRFAGFNIITIKKQQIEITTAKFDNSTSVGQVQESDPVGTMPSGLVYWSMNGSNVYILPNTFFSFSSDASLAQLYTSQGSLAPDFNTNTFHYNVVLPAGTINVPVSYAITNHPGATISTSNAVNLTGSAAQRTTTLVVTAEDLINTQTYTIEFSVQANAVATLSSLTTNLGTLTPSFAPNIYNYTVNLDAGVTTVPIVSATPTDPDAEVVISQASSPDGLASITVTASDNQTINVYTVDFVVASSNAKMITSFNIAGQTAPETINQENLTISVSMPEGSDVSSLAPTITYIGSSLNPDTGVPQNFNEPVVYTVTAQDNSSVQYTASVVLVPSNQDNALLSDLYSIPGQLSPEFNPSVVFYNVEIPDETTEAQVYAVPEDVQATVRIFNPVNVNGSMAQRTATVMVIAPDNITTKTYSLLYLKPNSIDDISEKEMSKVYPNPTNSVINIELFQNSNGATIRIHNGFGKTMRQFELKRGKTKTIFDVGSLSDGAYFIIIQKDGKTESHKIIKHQ